MNPNQPQEATPNVGSATLAGAASPLSPLAATSDASQTNVEQPSSSVPEQQQQQQQQQHGLSVSNSEGDVEALTRAAASDSTNSASDASQSATTSVSALAPESAAQSHQPSKSTSSEGANATSSTAVTNPNSATAGASAQPKKFTSLNVNKKFLEKASPTPSAALPSSLKLGASVSPRPSNRLLSPSTTSRLTSVKLSSVPKPQPVGWATTKPVATATGASSASTTAITAKSSPAPAPALPAAKATPVDPLPSEASAAAKATASPKPASQPVQQPIVAVSNVASAPSTVASPRLVGMGRESPRPGSAGIDVASGAGRASPGLKNASLGSSFRAASPASVSRAPWAGVKSSLSPNPTTSGSRSSALSDFPTAAEAAKAKQEQEERAAAAAAREAARQQAALQNLDRFRGAALGSGKHWDEMEDEDLGEVVEFGDGTQYKIPSNEEQKPISKEERFKDVSHDRSWPPRGTAQPSTAPSDRQRASGPATWGPSKAREAATQAEKPALSSAPAPTPTTRPSRSEQRAERVIIPTTGASVSLRSPEEPREPPMSYGYGRDRRHGPNGPFATGRTDTSAVPAPSQHATQAVRAWGPLAQRQASLNPGAAAPVTVTKQIAQPAAADAPSDAALASKTSTVPSTATETPASSAATVQHSVPSATSVSLPSTQIPSAAPPSISPAARHSVAVPTSAHSNATAQMGRPLPPHLIATQEHRPAAYANRPLPPHLAQGLRASASSSDSASAGRKTTFDDLDGRRPSPAAAPGHQTTVPQPPSQPATSSGRAPWGPRGLAQVKQQGTLESHGTPYSASQTPAARQSQASIPTAATPSAATTAAAAPAAEDRQAAIERARKRREEEEKARLAEKERAMQKALAIEQKLRAAEQAKEAEEQRRAQAQARAAAPQIHQQQQSRVAGPADNVVSWRIAKPPPQQSGGSTAESRASRAASNDVGADAPVARSQPRSQPRQVSLLDRISPDSRDTERSQGERQHQSQEQTPVIATNREVSNGRKVMMSSPTRSAQYKATANDSAQGTGLDDAGATAPEISRVILSRSDKAVSTGTDVSAAFLSHQRTQQQRLSDDKEHARDRPKRSKDSAIVGRSRTATGVAEKGRAKEPLPERQTSQKQSARSSLSPTPPAAVMLYPLVKQEPLQTRAEVAQDAAPAWNRFAVQIKESRSRSKPSRYQQKQLAAKAALMNATTRAVYPLTWEPPLTHLSIKTLSRDDQLFSKRYHRGTVIAPVRLPQRRLPRGLPAVVPLYTSHNGTLSARKQARFDLTPRWSDEQSPAALDEAARANGLAAGAQIQVKLPGHLATVVHPSLTSNEPPTTLASLSRSSLVNTSTDAIIDEVLSSASPARATLEDDRRRLHEPMAASASASLGPLDHAPLGFSRDMYGYGDHAPQHQQLNHVQPSHQQQSQPGSHSTSAAAYRGRGRRGSNAAVAFYEDRQVNTPSPVSFMVSSEIRNDMGASRGALPAFGLGGSARGSQNQTPASANSMLPSPNLSTQGTWGQSSLTFPMMEPRSSYTTDRDHIKSVWSLASDSHARETQNSLKDIGDDFLPSTMPMSVHDFRSDEPALTGNDHATASSAVTTGNNASNLRQTSPSSFFGRFSQQYGGGTKEAGASAKSELSPVASRSNGFEPTTRSPSLGTDASSHLQAVASQQRGTGYGSTMNGMVTPGVSGYGHAQATGYSPRERQHHDGSHPLSHSAFGAYGGFGSSSANTTSGGSGAGAGAGRGASHMSGLTSDSIYGVSTYGGSVTPGRQHYGQYSTQTATAARSAPGSPYSGMGRHANNLGSGGAGYSLFSNGGSGSGASGNANAAGLGVMDDLTGMATSGTFGSGRGQYYGVTQGTASRAYASSGAFGSASHSPSGQHAQRSKESSSTSSTAPTSVVAGSTLRPAASVFNPQHYSPSRQQQRQAATSHQQHQQQQESKSLGTAGGPLDRDPNQYSGGAQHAPSAYGANSGYAGFTSNTGLW
ncbi:hypothetical protein BCV70DRAFT_97815 [Testicularia cyperi]|uniref:Uncharacterized protein n=1 Tax=Testicularia cyperi TaxID=1882483 RepID=A0A317XTH0_9BASI|nr:hypothetical protein BCV70DRAFT_97815 [Testicularia cyperi]